MSPLPQRLDVQSSTSRPENHDPCDSSPRSFVVGPSADTATDFCSRTRFVFADFWVDGQHHHGCRQNIIVPHSIISDIILLLLRLLEKQYVLLWHTVEAVPTIRVHKPFIFCPHTMML